MALQKTWIDKVKGIFAKNASSTAAAAQTPENTECDTTLVQPIVAPTPVPISTLLTYQHSSVSDTPHLVAKQWLRGCVILDTETTGLESDDEIVEISIIDDQGNVLIDTRVRPKKPIPSIATDIHGIRDDMVTNAPSWNEVHGTVFSALADRHVVIFNAEFDLRMLQQTASKHGLTCPPITASCAMTAYAEYYADWDESHTRWRFQNLNRAATQQRVEVEGNRHSALVDCMTTLGVIQAMAANPVHRERFSQQIEAGTLKKCGCDFVTLVRAYMEYADFSGWNTSKSVAIDKCESWVMQSIGPAGHALTWKETGVDPLARWKSDRLLLTHRIDYMTPSEVAIALDAGEDINQGDDNGVTPLIRAAQRTRDLAVLQLLLDRGADVNARDVYGQTALHRAVTRGFTTLGCVQLLVKAGASINIADNANATPLSLAIAARCDDAVTFLKNNGSKIELTEGMATPLHFAARHNPEQIHDLLQRGANPNAYDEKKRTPLYWAMWGKPENMVLSVRFLFEGGADIEWKNSDKETPLIYALKNSLVPAEVVEILISFGADIKTKNRYGTTPLHFAAKHSIGPEKIMVLLNHGADSENCLDRAGKKPKDYLAGRKLFPWPKGNEL